MLEGYHVETCNDSIEAIEMIKNNTTPYFVAELETGYVVIGDSQRFKGYTLFLCKRHETELHLLENEFKLSDQEYLNIQHKLDLLDDMIPSFRLIILPIASKVLEIPYKYLLKHSAKNVMLLGVFLRYISDNTNSIISTSYPLISDFLMGYPNDRTYISTASSYKIKLPEYIINNNTPIFGFKSKILKYNILSCICGVLNSSKKNLNNLITGDSIICSNSNEFDQIMIDFFTEHFSNNLDIEYKKLEEKMDEYF
jgi:hypothetical protein